MDLNRPGGERAPQGYLIGDDCPSFPSYQAAFRAFFYGDFAGTPGGQVPSASGWCVSSTAGRGWTGSALPRPTLQVHVGGSDVAGARVELNSATHRADARVTEAGQVSLPLPDGLPPGAWLYLAGTEVAGLPGDRRVPGTSRAGSRRGGRGGRGGS